MDGVPVKLPLEEIWRLCREYRVAEMSVFGSALRPDFGPNSDVDLLVEFQPDARIGLISYARLQRELSAVIGRPVDLVSAHGLKPFVEAEVLSSARSIYHAA